jgi:hypothetical protein
LHVNLHIYHFHLPVSQNSHTNAIISYFISQNRGTSQQLELCDLHNMTWSWDMHIIKHIKICATDWSNKSCIQPFFNMQTYQIQHSQNSGTIYTIILSVVRMKWKHIKQDYWHQKYNLQGALQVTKLTKWRHLRKIKN